MTHSRTSLNQDMRTALFDVAPDLGAQTTEPSIREIVRGYYGPHFSSDKADELTAQYLATLTAPPRPDHAGGVDAEIRAAFNEAAEARDEAGYSGTPASCIRFLAAEVERLEKLTPSQAPDKAAERTALKRVDVRAEADGYEFRADEGDYTPTEHERAMLEDFGNGLITRVEEELAPKPTGTEAGRGMGAFAPECHWGGGNDVIWCSTCGEEYAYAKGETRPACPRAATPTPPTPDSTAQGDGTSQEGGR